MKRTRTAFVAMFRALEAEAKRDIEGDASPELQTQIARLNVEAWRALNRLRATAPRWYWRWRHVKRGSNEPRRSGRVPTLGKP